MRKRIRGRIILLVVVTLVTGYYIVPSVSPVESLPSLFPGLLPRAEKINLGLDLQGGTHLVLEVQAEKAVENATERQLGEVRRLLEKEKIDIAQLDRDFRRVLHDMVIGHDIALVRNEYTTAAHCLVAIPPKVCVLPGNGTYHRHHCRTNFLHGLSDGSLNLSGVDDEGLLLTTAGRNRFYHRDRTYQAGWLNLAHGAVNNKSTQGCAG